MKILVDENIPKMTVEGLRALGHDLKDIRGTSECGLPDPDLWQIAVAESRLLVTTDKGFSSYRTSAHHGILIVRLRQPNRHKINNAVMQATFRGERLAQSACSRARCNNQYLAIRLDRIEGLLTVRHGNVFAISGPSSALAFCERGSR